MMDQAAKIFEQQRPQLFRLAYGMLGRVAPAEDAVQEAFLRWQKADLDDVRSRQAYLSAIVSNICLDEIKSARNRKENYIGPNLPEPLLESQNKTPDQSSELAESLSMALLVVLKQLSPVQRAVFLLREVFDYDYASIADIINKSESYCRKIAQRARDAVAQNRPRFEPSQKEQHELVASFMEAVKKGNIEELEDMLAGEAILYSDGGGKVAAVPKPVEGAHKIARFMLGLRKQVTNEVHFEFCDVNGNAGMTIHLSGRLFGVWSFLIENKRIKKIFVVLNPDKLEHLKNKDMVSRIE